MEIKIPVGSADPAILACPSCGETYGTHHGAVDVYVRAAEDEPGIAWTIDAGLARGAQKEGKAFLGRRDDIRIEFWCEYCGEVGQLCIVQHKGCTLLYWLNVPSPEVVNRFRIAAFEDAVPVPGSVPISPAPVLGRSPKRGRDDDSVCQCPRIDARDAGWDLQDTGERQLTCHRCGQGMGLIHDLPRLVWTAYERKDGCYWWAWPRRGGTICGHAPTWEAAETSVKMELFGARS